MLENDGAPGVGIPAGRALETGHVIYPPEGITPVDPRDRPKDIFDESDDIGVDVIGSRSLDDKAITETI
jgi:hypothetical protein